MVSVVIGSLWLCILTSCMALSPQLSPLLLPHPMHYSESPCKVTEGQTRPGLMVSTKLFVQASLNYSNNCWHSDLEPVVLEESSLLRATVGRGEQSVLRDCLRFCLKQQTTSQGSVGSLITRSTHSLLRAENDSLGKHLLLLNSVIWWIHNHIGSVIGESINVFDGLGLPKIPFKKKLLKDDYRIETPSFKTAWGKLLWKLQQWRDRERTA